jgi:hypothetical protein
VQLAALSAIQPSRDVEQSHKPDGREDGEDDCKTEPESRPAKNWIRLLKLRDKEDEPKREWHEKNQWQRVIDTPFPFFREGFASPSSDLG